MDDVQRYHQVLRSVWRSGEVPSLALPGMQQMPYYGQRAHCETPELLFLGLNPSYREDVLLRHWQACFPGGPSFQFDNLCWLASRTDAQLDALEPLLEKLDQHSRANYRQYYGQLEAIAHRLDAARHWHALDVFPMRVTVQAELVQAIASHDVALSGTVGALFDAFKALLQSLRPRLVIVVNAYASRLLVTHLPLSRTGQGSQYAWEALPGTVFLLSSMLTGGRALDEFSRERLVSEAQSVWAGRPQAW